MKKRYFLFFIATLIAIQGIFVPKPKTVASSCKDIKVIWVDGSGAQIGGTDNNYLDFRNAVDEVLKRTALSYDFYELGSEEHGGYRYPAAGIGIESLRDFFTTVGAVFSAGESYEYGASVWNGVGELSTYTQEIAASCPNTKFIIGGLSQGGGVVSESLPYLNSDKIIYAATFGDAKLWLPEGFGTYPAACRGKNLSPYRAYVPDCFVYQGILQGLKPYQPSENLNGKLGAWCNYHDIICSSYINWMNLAESFEPHGSYGNSYNANHLYNDAAEVIYQKVLNEFEIETRSHSTTQNVAILIDTTGSMRELIDSYKQEATRLATEVLNSGGSVALYEYRDVAANNFLPKQHCNFETCTLAKFQSELDSLTVQDGGDTPESVLSAAMTALNELNWQNGAAKSIVVLSDAGYHETEEFEGRTINLQTVVNRSLEIDPVNFYTITPSTQIRNYSSLVGMTNGKSFSSTNELSFSTDFILSRPDVKLSRETYSGKVGEEFYFDASETNAEAEIEKYEWDLDFDGIFETTTNASFVSKTYNRETSGFMQVKVTDITGKFGTMSAKVKVSNQAEEIVLPEITELSYEKKTNSIEVKFKTDAYRTLIVVNNAYLGLTDKEEIKINDINFEIENEIKLIPYGLNGYAGEAKVIKIALEQKHEEEKFDDKNNEQEKRADEEYLEVDGEKIKLPQTPNCGQN